MAKPKVNPATRLMLEQALRIRQKRRSAATLSYQEWLPQASPDFNWNFPHLKYVQQKVDDFTAGKIKRLMVFMPPQHGKSSVLTIRYPVYLLERNPKTRIVVASYSADLAEKFSRKIRGLVRARGIVEVSNERSAVDEWETLAGGGVKAIGIGGSVTGFSADVIIIDDPVKGRMEANSKATRETAWKWFTDDILTRQQAETPIILIMTRWHEDDLAGRLLDTNQVDTEYEWHVVRLPALSEGNDPEDYPERRELGEVLCPELHPKEQILEIQRHQGSSFAALYQQRPAPASGEVWQKKWFTENRDDDSEIRKVPKFPDGKKITQVWDLALETNQRNDFSAMVEGCMDEEGNIYISAMVNERMTFPEIVRRMRVENERLRYGGEICVEDKASGKPARQQLKLQGVPVIEVPAGTTDKKARANSVTHYAEGGNIYFVDQPGNLNHELLSQLLVFDNGRWDDLHDAFVHLLRRLTNKARRWDAKTIQKLMLDLTDQETLSPMEKKALVDAEREDTGLFPMLQ
jgi:predicted phage terminase large subunit-like protein